MNDQVRDRPKPPAASPLGPTDPRSFRLGLIQALVARVWPRIDEASGELTKHAAGTGFLFHYAEQRREVFSYAELALRTPSTSPEEPEPL